MSNEVSELAGWLEDAWTAGDALSSPKLPTGAAAVGSWHRYYAGFADTFVADVVARFPETTGLVLDPWNGSGTTTSVAAEHGLDAKGFDINPSAVVIAKARLLQSNVAPSILPLTRELLLSVDGKYRIAEDDLLLAWMTPRAVSAVRRLTATISRALVDPKAGSEPAVLATEMSSLAALFYLGLFRVVRRALSPFMGSNPTWIRQRVPEREKVDIDLRTLRPWLISAMEDLASTVSSRGLTARSDAHVEISVADSGALPIESGSAHAVITSPPYCTRIDYGIATLPELAVLGMSSSSFRSLRDRLIGTPTRDGSFATSDRRWGETAVKFLSQVADHSSYAATSYYLPFFSQYFAGMWRSLSEIGRVTVGGGPIVLVVQDSHFKDIHADVPSVMCEMAESLGWTLGPRRDFHVKTRASINPATYKYRQPTLATEAVLGFSK